MLPQPRRHVVPPREVDVRHVRGVYHLLPSEQSQSLDGGVLLVVEFGLARRLVRVEHLRDLRQRRPLLRLGLPLLLHPLHPLLDLRQVRKGQLEVDQLRVPDRVDGPVDVYHVLVLEAPDDVDYGVALPDGGEELVPQSLPVARPLDEPGDVDEFESRGHDLDALVDDAQHGEAGVGHLDYARVRLDGAEGVIRRLGALRLGEGVEEGGFSDVRETDYGGLELHAQRRPGVRPPGMGAGGGGRRGTDAEGSAGEGGAGHAVGQGLARRGGDDGRHHGGA